MLNEAKNCIFCSINKDGTIHAVPMRFTYEKGIIFILTPDASKKVRNVKRNNNATVLIEGKGKGAIIYGKAEVDDGDLFQWGSLTGCTSEKYMAKELVEPYLRAISTINTKWVRVIVKPKHMGSFDYAKDEIYPPKVRQIKRNPQA